MIDFTKMQGLGNDFIVMRGPQEINVEQIVSYCDRHYGIGADGFIIVTKHTAGPIEMKYWNADGSLAEMCGNGLRCAARFAVDNGLVPPGEFTVQTAMGLLKAIYDGHDSKAIEVQVGKVVVNNKPIQLSNLTFYTATVGNPHAITYVASTDTAPVLSVGPRVEKDGHFPFKTNVEFVQVMSPNKIKMRVWERGVGETLACTTGIVACALTTVKHMKGQLPLAVEVRGGTTKVWLDSEGYSRMSGPAEVAFIGQVS